MQKVIALFLLFFCSLAGGAESKNEATAGSGRKPISPHQFSHNGSGVEPHFSIYFDLLLADQPGKANFSFLNFHPLLFFEIMPNADIQFAFEVRSDPRYFELDYQITPAVQLRAGKIWIPFDDMNPHNIYGGRIDVNRLRLGGDYFLPDIWTDLGVGTKITLSDSSAVASEMYLYAVNGFPQAGGTVTPNFQDQSVTSMDNNSDKGVGGRLHVLFERVLGFGLSAYKCRWSSETALADVPLGLAMLGIDMQLRLGDFSFKLGGTGMWVQNSILSAYARHGTYVELSQRIANIWRVYLRAGHLDTDDRSTDINDVVIVGGGVAYKPGVIQLSLDYQHDIKDVANKLGYSFTSARVAIQM